MLTRPDDTPDQARARAICARFGNRPDALIEILHALQHELRHVPEPCLPVIAAALNLSRAEVYGVVTFYHDFRRTPAGRHVVKLCRAESCQAMGGAALAAHAEARLGMSFGTTRADGAVTLEPVYCLGLCSHSPAMLVDGEPYGRVDPARFDEVLADAMSEAAR
jgi:formate dehydrogenase subunit gamma